MSYQRVDVPPAVHQLVEEIKQALGQQLDTKWRNLLEQWDGVSQAKKQAHTAFLHGLRNRLYHVLIEITEIAEIHSALALFFLEMQCHWTLLNLRLQYMVNRVKNVPSDLFYRASCISLIIDALEPFLSVDNLHDCCDSLVGFKKND